MHFKRISIAFQYDNWSHETPRWGNTLWENQNIRGSSDPSRAVAIAVTCSLYWDWVAKHPHIHTVSNSALIFVRIARTYACVQLPWTKKKCSNGKCSVDEMSSRESKRKLVSTSSQHFHFVRHSTAIDSRKFSDDFFFDQIWLIPISTCRCVNFENWLIWLFIEYSNPIDVDRDAQTFARARASPVGKTLNKINDNNW